MKDSTKEFASHPKSGEVWKSKTNVKVKIVAVKNNVVKYLNNGAENEPLYEPLNMFLKNNILEGEVHPINVKLEDVSFWKLVLGAIFLLILSIMLLAAPTDSQMIDIALTGESYKIPSWFTKLTDLVFLK